MDLGTDAVIAKYGTVDDEDLALAVQVADHNVNDARLRSQEARDEAARAGIAQHYDEVQTPYKVDTRGGCFGVRWRLHKAGAEIRRLEAENKYLWAGQDAYQKELHAVSARVHIMLLLAPAVACQRSTVHPPSTLCSFTQYKRRLRAAKRDKDIAVNRVMKELQAEKAEVARLRRGQGLVVEVRAARMQLACTTTAWCASTAGCGSSSGWHFYVICALSWPHNWVVAFPAPAAAWALQLLSHLSVIPYLYSWLGLPSATANEWSQPM
jgi:hypothetical protein